MERITHNVPSLAGWLVSCHQAGWTYITRLRNLAQMQRMALVWASRWQWGHVRAMQARRSIAGTRAQNGSGWLARACDAVKQRWSCMSLLA